MGLGTVGAGGYLNSLGDGMGHMARTQVIEAAVGLGLGAAQLHPKVHLQRFRGALPPRPQWGQRDWGQGTTWPRPPTPRGYGTLRPNTGTHPQNACRRPELCSALPLPLPLPPSPALATACGSLVHRCP